MRRPSALQGTPLPYFGQFMDRLTRVGQPHVLRECGRDRSRRVAYAYNALGFRGPEFDPDAPLRVYAFGESDAFGLGVDFADCWPTRVVAALQARLGADAICYMNFADMGASNAHVARAVLSQCAAAPPDLALVNFADPRRTEGAIASHVYHVGQWLTMPELERDIRTVPPPVRGVLLDALRRGRAWLEFTNDEQNRLAALREVLLVQSFLAARGIQAVATCRSQFDVGRGGAADHAACAPLLALVDRQFLQPHSLAAANGDLSSDGQHPGPRTHAEIARHVHERLVARGEVERLAGLLAERTSGGSGPRNGSAGKTLRARVRAFYDDLPFNQHGSVQDAAASVRASALDGMYPDLAALLRSGRVRSVVEIGCGGGWLAASMALHYDVQVTAVDFCAPALQRAGALAAELGVAGRIRFVQSDLFEFPLGEAADLVVSIGVLHHTHDAARAFDRVQALVRAGGAFYLGLYHAPGRRVFLDMFERIRAERGDEAAFAHYRALDGVRAADETLLRSWFRDQVLHPHETQHTLREVCGWLDRAGLELRSTSINQFAPVRSVEELFELELEYAERSRQANLRQQRYFPGFFTVLAERPAPAPRPRPPAGSLMQPMVAPTAASELLAGVTAAHGVLRNEGQVAGDRDLAEPAALLGLDEPWLWPHLQEHAQSPLEATALHAELAALAGRRDAVTTFAGIDAARAAVLRAAAARRPARPHVLVVGDVAFADKAADTITGVPIGEFEAASARLTALGDGCALLVVEPWLPRPASGDALRALVADARARGVPVAVDETRTAYRAAATTVHAELGLAADWVLLGPALACGLPFAAVVGSLPDVRANAVHPAVRAVVGAVATARGPEPRAGLAQLGSGLIAAVDEAAQREQLAIEWRGPASMPSLHFRGQENADGALIAHHFALELGALGWQVRGPLLFPSHWRRQEAGALHAAFGRALARIRVLLIELNSWLSGGMAFVFPGGDPLLRARGLCQYRYPRDGAARVAVAPDGAGVRIELAPGPLGSVTSSGFYLPTGLRGDVDVEARYVLRRWQSGPDSACLGLFVQNASSSARYYSQVMSTADRPRERTVAAGLAGQVSERVPAPADSGWLRVQRRGDSVFAFHRADERSPWRQLGECRDATRDDLFVCAKVWSKVACEGLIAEVAELRVRGEVAPQQQPLLGPQPDPRDAAAAGAARPAAAAM